MDGAGPSQQGLTPSDSPGNNSSTGGDGQAKEAAMRSENPEAKTLSTTAGVVLSSADEGVRAAVAPDVSGGSIGRSQGPAVVTEQQPGAEPGRWLDGQRGVAVVQTSTLRVCRLCRFVCVGDAVDVRGTACVLSFLLLWEPRNGDPPLDEERRECFFQICVRFSSLLLVIGAPLSCSRYK